MPFLSTGASPRPVPAGIWPRLSKARGRRWALAAAVLSTALILAGIPTRLAAQAAVQPDSSVPLFVVLAAANAAGYDDALESPQNSPIRKQVREDIARAKPASLEALRAFYAAHRQPGPGRNLGQYVSFALLINGPPEFAFRVKEAELPPEVAALRDLRPLLAAFYTEAGLAKLWEKYRPAYEAELSRYDDGLAEVMLEVNGYLRIASSGFLGRNFAVYVDLLGAPGHAHARSFGPDYYVVLGASAQPQVDEVRHGYLHYVLEPMAGKYRSVVQSKADLHSFAEGAHALDPVLRADFRLLMSESLIRAAELRMAKMPAAQKEQKLREILAEGHFLAPYFFEALEKFEKQEVGMRIYYADMIEQIDVGHEQKRLAKVSFRDAAAGRTPHLQALTAPAGAAAPGAGPAGGQGSSGPAAHTGETAGGTPASEEERLLLQGEDALARQDLTTARKAFETAAAAGGPMRGRAIYGLALVATQDRQPLLAKTYFQQALEASRDPHVLAWANIYLGRIFDMEENRELAVKHYREALSSGHNQPEVRSAAERGLKEPFRRSPRPGTGTESRQP